MENCNCSETKRSLAEESLEAFGAVRSRCPALRLFVPDDVWPDFQKWHHQADEVAHHRSVLLLALERGHLGRVTSAVHRYLITAGLPRLDVTQQYLNDLRERWMHYSDPIKRNQKFRIFFGRLVELQFAEWLESQRWTVCGLEALRDGPDVEAYTTSEGRAAFEVKFVGVENDDFALVLKSLAGQRAVGPVSPYAAANYLLFRAYEAAKQLQVSPYNRIAVLVVHGLTWDRFDLQLRDGWIDWVRPSFFPGDRVWQGFLECQQRRYPNIAADLQPALADLNAIWILKMLSDYQYNREFEVRIRAA